MHTLPPNFLLINKPAGWTSFDVVNFIRKQIRVDSQKPKPEFQSPEGVSPFLPATEGSQKNEVARVGAYNKPKRVRVGHAGTLDPFATGLLIVGVGREATRTLDQFKNLPKTYVATIKLGQTSTTGDPTGEISNYVADTPRPAEVEIETILKTFLGKQSQTPPMFSAKSIGGVRLYKLARQGKTVERPRNEIEIFDISLVSYTWPLLTMEVSCSAGTYIRTLAEDIGQKLGTGAYCLVLKRTAIGPYLVDQAQAVPL